MTVKSSASSADVGEKTETLKVLADGVYALAAEGDPDVGAHSGHRSLGLTSQAAS